MIDEKELKQVEETQEVEEFVQQQVESEALKSHRISIRATPEIQRILDKSRRWREDPNQLWVASSEIDQSEKLDRNPNYEVKGD
jgi:hypothetical protein